MALPANALTSLTTLKGELGIGDGDNSQDTQLERLVGVASDLIEQFCNRKFARSTETNERVAGFGTARLYLGRTPIVSVTTVVIDGTTVDAAEYYVEDAEAGALLRSGAVWDWTKPELGDRGHAAEERRYLVTYVGGYYLPWDTAHTRDLPFPIEEACLIAVVGRLRAKGKYQNLQAETSDGDTRAWYDFTLPASARQLLEPYKRVVVA